MTPAVTLIHERVDDIPLLIGLAHRLKLPEVLDRHLGAHPLHQGLSNGTLATVWIAFILGFCKPSVAAGKMGKRSPFSASYAPAQLVPRGI